MNITVTTTQVSVDTDYILNDSEYNVNQCYFTFSEEYTNDLVKKAIFVQGTSTIEMSIINNQCQIPEEVLNNGQFQIRVYAYEVDGDELLLRYSPSYTTAYVRTGSYLPNAESPEVITPTQFEQYMQAMNDGLNEVANVDIDATQTSTGGTVTITNRYGEEKTVVIKDGEKGETGATPNIQIGTVVTGDHSEVTRTGTNENPIFNFVLEKGDKGDTGNGIANVTKTATSGLVDTYTITYTNGTTTTFNVTNGKGITNIAKTSTSGLEDTYTITYNDNTTSTFTVTNGNGISSIEKTGTQDNVDEYTIYYTNGTTSTFTVTNSTVTNQEFEELKAEHEELVNTLPRVEGTGESITIDNTAQYKMNVALNPSELSQDGTPTPTTPIPIKKVTGNNSITVCGKNLFAADNRLRSVSTGCMSTEVTANSFILNGTTSWSNRSLTIGNSFKNQDMYIKATFKSSLARKIAITVYGTNTLLYTTSDLNSIDSVSYNLISNQEVTIGQSFNTSNYDYLVLRFWNNDTGTALESAIDLYISDICINVGSEIVYEPYQGQTFTINLGANLFDKDSATYDNLHYKNDSGTVSSSSSSGYTTSYVGVQPNTTYIIDGVGINRMYYYDSSKNWISRSSSGISLPHIFTTPNNCYYIQFQYTMSTYDANKVMIEEGTTTSYKPYGTTPIEYCKIGDYSDEFALSTGKNLFNIGTVVEGQLNDNGSVVSSNTSWRTSDYIPITALQTYCLSWVSTNNYFQAQVGFFNENKTIIEAKTNLTRSGYYNNTFVAIANAKYVRITYSVLVSGNPVPRNNIQLETSSTPTSWEPYGIGNWYFKKNIGKVVLDGTETWNYAPNNYVLYLLFTNYLIASGKTTICSHYKSAYNATSSTGAYNNGNNTACLYIGPTLSNHRIYIRDDRFTNADDFEDWLTTHNVTLYYILATPTGEPITDTTLINQLNNLYNQIKSYKGQTNITQTNAELPFNIDASALYDLNNLISRVATLEVEV